MFRRFPTMAAFSTAALLGCLLLGPVASLAAIATIDVGAAAVGNEWRPASCDAVKDGVVLTNMVANVKAIIDGCAITLTSESNAANSAIKVASFGAGSSLELRNCAVSASFTATSQTSAISIGTVGAGTSIVLSNTTVTATARSIVGLYLTLGATNTANITVDHSAFDLDGVVDISAIATGDRGSHFGSNSVFNFADSTAVVRGKLIHAVRIRAGFHDNAVISILRSTFTTIETGGNHNRGFRMESTFRDDCSFVLSHSAINATGSVVTAVDFANSVTYGKNFSVSVLGSNITGTSATATVLGVSLGPQTIGEQFAVAVAESTIAMTSSNGEAKALSFASSQIGRNASIKVTDSTFNASGSSSFVVITDSSTWSGRPTIAFLRSNIIGRSAGLGYAPPFSALSNAWSNEGLALTLEGSTFYSSAGLGSSLLLLGTFPALDITVVSSVLEASATQDAQPAGGVISFESSGAWNGGSLSVSESSLTLLDGTTAAANARFVQWPNTMSGSVPQMFDTVTLSAPAGVLAAPFAANAGGTYSPGTTFCANNVKWANGTAVVAGPPEFTAVTTCQVSHTVAPTASLSATASPKPTKTVSLSPASSLTLTVPPTASAAPSKTASTSTTHSSVPTASRPLTASKRLTQSKPQSKTATVAPTKTLPRTATPLTPAPATPAPETPTPATPAPAASSATSGSAPTPAPATPAPIVRSSQSSAATPAPALTTPAPAVQSSVGSSASSAPSAAPTPAPAASQRSSRGQSSRSGSATPAPAAGSKPSSHGSSPMSSATPAPVTAAPAISSPTSGSSSEDSGAGPTTPAPPGPALSPAAGFSAAVLVAVAALVFAPV